MKIPKYILHPSLLLASGGLLMYLLWQNTPTPTEVHNTLEDQAAQTEPLPMKAQLSEIGDIASDGKLILKDSQKAIKINDPHFENISDKQRLYLQKFLTGKLLEIPAQAEANGLNLPIKLYDQTCFTLPKEELSKNQCPILLKP